MAVEHVHIEPSEYDSKKHKCVLCQGACMEDVLVLRHPDIRIKRYMHISCFKLLRGAEYLETGGHKP